MHFRFLFKLFCSYVWSGRRWGRLQVGRQSPRLCSWCSMWFLPEGGQKSWRCWWCSASGGCWNPPWWWPASRGQRFSPGARSQRWSRCSVKMCSTGVPSQLQTRFSGTIQIKKQGLTSLCSTFFGTNYRRIFLRSHYMNFLFKKGVSLVPKVSVFKLWKCYGTKRWIQFPTPCIGCNK